MQINKQTTANTFLCCIADQINQYARDNDKHIIAYLNLVSRVLSKHERAIVVSLLKH